LLKNNIDSDMKKIGIFYGSSTGNTSSAAKQMAELLGEDIAQAYNVTDVKASTIDEYSNIIIGCSTWGYGELQDDFLSFIDVLEACNLEGKKIALFGYGDQDSYCDTFVDALGIIYEAIKDKGCSFIGAVPTDEYDFDESAAVIDGKFIGLPLDEENQPELSEGRINDWINELKEQF
jgi:flavodoxin I